MKPILKASALSKKFLRPQNVDILRDITLELYPRESIAIMGASGEGKSTLLHILGTLESATGGELEIAGKSVAASSSADIRNHHIGFVFQSYNLLADYSALHNVLMPALIAGHDIGKGSKSYCRAVELLKRVGLVDRMHFPTKLLSGGEKQRVAIARALCNNPEIILADEPSGNLDHATSVVIHNLLLECAEHDHKGLIIVTHDEELAKLCTHKLILKEGQLSNGRT